MRHLSFLFASLFITLFSFAQNLDFSVAVVGSDFSTEIFLGSEPAIVSDMPYWSVGESPEWADVSIGSNIIGSPNDFDFIIEYSLIISGVPSPNNIGENIVTVNLINPWTGDILDVITYVITVIETAVCVCPAVYDPVCGIDGVTYSNSCDAACASIEVVYEGECESNSGCIGDFNIIEQEYIAGFAGMMLHLQVQNNGNDLSTAMASVILANTCNSSDQFTFESWASGDVLDMYFNYTCLSMAPYIEPFEAILVLSGSGNCAQDVPFVFDPQGNSTTEGCTADDGTFYANGEIWNPDDCTFCACEGGDIMCAVVDCAMPDCDNPIFIEGECCPICPDDCEESLDDEILALVEMFGVYDCETAVAALTEFSVSCDMDLVAFGPIVGIEIEPETFLNDYCPCSCESGNDILGCTDPQAINYNPMATTENGSCEYIIDYGCIGEEGDLFPVGAIIEYDNEVCFCFGSDATVFPAMGVWQCEEIITTGCMDEDAINFNPQASIDDGSCIYSTNNGCTADNGDFYPIGATFTNFNPNIGICEICFCAPNPNSDILEGLWECEEIIDCGFGMIPGCTDPSASNYNEWANVDDGNCEYGCNCPLDLWAPVCGENGITYAYDCFAECEGVAFTDGECIDPCELMDCAFGCINGECIEPTDFGCTSDDGNWYPFGAIIEVECNTCSCTPGFNPNTEGFWMCTMMACEDEGCWEDGEFYEIGSELFLNECEYLECEGEDNWSDVIEIPDCGQTDFGCELDGEIYPFGSSIEQGCNSCYCQAGFNPNANGIWLCSEMACAGCTDPNALNYDEYADWDDGSCEYNNSDPNWNYTNTGTNHTLVLQEDMLTDLFGTSISSGDWIGAFFEVNDELICGGYAVWEGSTTIIPAQGDDLTTDFQDGFTTGEPFQWMVWDASENIIITVYATYTEEDQSTFVPNGISVITSLIAAPLISEQEVELITGWNMFSTYMSNEDLTVENICLPYVQDVVIVKNNVGDAYLPEWDFDGIGVLISGQGYQAKMAANHTFIFEGDYLTPEDNPITLTEGWNMIAYLRTESAPTIEVFTNINDLVIVKDNLGMAYLPEYDFNGIGNMLAGQGYQVKVLSEQILEYLPNDMEYRMTPEEVKTELDYFVKPINTGSNMSLVLPEDVWVNKPMLSDEIAVYDNRGLLVGAMPYQTGNMVIPIYGNDELSPEKDGLSTGETFSLTLWSNSNEREYPIIVAWNKEAKGYQTDNIIYASQLDFTQEQNSLHSVNLFPNPTDLKTELHAVLHKDSQLALSIFNLLGENVFTSVKNYQKGAIKEVLNIEYLPAGSYILQLKTNDELFNKSLIVR